MPAMPGMHPLLGLMPAGMQGMVPGQGMPMMAAVMGGASQPAKAQKSSSSDISGSSSSSSDSSSVKPTKPGGTGKAKAAGAAARSALRPPAATEKKALASKLAKGTQ